MTAVSESRQVGKVQPRDVEPRFKEPKAAKKPAKKAKKKKQASAALAPGERRGRLDGGGAFALEPLGRPDF